MKQKIDATPAIVAITIVFLVSAIVKLLLLLFRPFGDLGILLTLGITILLFSAMLFFVLNRHMKKNKNNDKDKRKILHG